MHSASLVLVPPIRLQNVNYIQPIDSAVDVSAFTDLALQLTIPWANADTGQIDIYLSSALDNRDERYLRLRQLVSLSSTTIISTQRWLFTFTGAGEATSASTPTTGTPGFGRYVRLEVDMSGNGVDMIFDVQALLRAR